MDRIDAGHQVQILVTGRLWLVVGRRSGDAQQLALTGHRKLAAGGDHGAPYLGSQRTSPRSKKSRSTVSSPILAYSSAILASWSAERAACSNVALALSSS